jgi:hypothetical protein
MEGPQSMAGAGYERARRKAIPRNEPGRHLLTVCARVRLECPLSLADQGGVGLQQSFWPHALMALRMGPICALEPTAIEPAERKFGVGLAIFTFAKRRGLDWSSFSSGLLVSSALTRPRTA